MTQLPDELVARYLAGTCTADEQKQVETWYASFDQQPSLSDAHPETDSPAYRHTLFQRIKERIQEAEPKVMPLPVSRQIGYYIAAASVAGLLLLGSLWYAQRETHTGITAAKPVVPAKIDVVFVNRQASIVRYSLPDRSTIWLNPGASIAHAARFSGPNRTVTFSGEGFFSVQKDARHPFVIHSGNMTTEVLGTSFNVRALQYSRQYEVAVVTGRVAVTIETTGQKKAQKIILTPRQSVNVNLQTAELITELKPLHEKQALYEPVSVRFDWVPLDEVARRLEAVYNVKIRLDNPALSHCRLRADFTNQHLPTILELISKSTDTSYKLDGNEITLFGAGCPE